MRRFSERNYYAVLGVVSSASRDEIKAAYRTLVRTAHPDRGGSADHFALIAEAWEILGDPATRSNYDAERRMQLRANRPYTTRLPDDRAPAATASAATGSAATGSAADTEPARERYSDEGQTEAERWRRNKRRF